MLNNGAAQTVPLHPGTLAAVVALALLYLGYEYRRDVANKIQQFREYRAARS
jgi:type VI protein secretion system component VasF